jgi:hypothetical protein
VMTQYSPPLSEGMLMREVKTFGFNRQKVVPLLEAASPRVCSKCDLWFAARKRQRVCDGCSPPSRRTLRALTGYQSSGTVSRGKHAGQGHRDSGFRQVYSESLGLTFRCPVTDPRAASLECRVLAHELAAKQR